MGDPRRDFVPTPPLRRFVKRWLFDGRLGIETDEQISADDLGLENLDNHGYEAAEWGSLRYALPRGAVGRDDVFVDIGSGLGRIVFLAASYPFRKVIGVELAEPLHRRAVANRESVLARRRRLRRRAPEIEFVLGDATTYELPGDATFVYLNNPFHGAVFETVMRNVIASVDAAPRHLTLMYRNPVEHARLEESGRFRLVRQSDRVGLFGRAHGVTTNVYELVAAR